MELISYEDFKKLDIRVAKIKEVTDHPDADKLYVVKIDLGEEERQIVAGIKPYIEKEALIGKEVVVIANMEPRKIRGIESKGMLLAAKDEEGLAIVTLNREVKPGSIVQ